ncbi:MAG: hypothetical protein PHG63_02885 [Candidatus Dojkabacteria bacterium]|nr:hypothetical protein [Candidatus Dojkabacteria bacterium]
MSLTDRDLKKIWNGVREIIKVEIRLSEERVKSEITSDVRRQIVSMKDAIVGFRKEIDLSIMPEMKLNLAEHAVLLAEHTNMLADHDARIKDVEDHGKKRRT